jgi:hypothetical protein
MGVKFANNAYGTLNASIASGDTSLTLSSGQGARFPSLGAGDYFYVTLIDTSNNLEIAKCTARSSDVLTITRGQEGTTARAYSVGDRVELRVTAAGLVDSTDYDAVLPSQTGNSGEFLTTNGTTASWAALPPSDNASALTTGTLAEARLPSGYTKFLYGANTSTTSDRAATGSFANHLTVGTFTIPSGYTGIVVVSANFSGSYEGNSGGGMHRLRLTGSATYTSDQFRHGLGYFNNFSPAHSSRWVFPSVSAGTYTAAVQIAEYQGDYIANYRNSTDVLACTVYVKKN